MAFNSIEYLYFLLIAVLGYQILPKSIRIPFLLGCSYYFYSCWNEVYLLLIIFSSIIDFLCARYMEKAIVYKKHFLWISLISNLSILFFFKYFGFFSLMVSDITSLIGRPIYIPLLELLLPVGISFYTFQTMSYSIDVYRGKIKAEENFIKFAFYVACFPQLVAGPIERASHLLPQIKNNYRLNSEDILRGLQLIVWGLFKKVVIADRISFFVDSIIVNGVAPNAGQVVLASFLAIILLYADFSAYADIAIGSARMIGLNIRANFNFPYFSKNIQEFWKRWHISLHTWFVDYVYYPLGGSRGNVSRWVFNVFIVFLLSGLWHGASYNFIVWAMLHVIFIFAYQLFVHISSKIPFLKRDFLVLTPFKMFLVQAQWAFSMLFFFSPNWEQSKLLMNALVSNWTFSASSVLPIAPFLIVVFFTSISFLYWAEWMHLRIAWSIRFERMSIIRRWICYYIILFSIMIFGVESNNPFIYFQF